MKLSNLDLISSLRNLLSIHLKCVWTAERSNTRNFSYTFGTFLPRSSHTLLSCEYIDLRTHWLKHVGTLPEHLVIM